MSVPNEQCHRASKAKKRVMQGKVSRQDVAELCVQLLSLPDALDTTFEIKSTVPFSQPYEPDLYTSTTERDWQVLRWLLPFQSPASCNCCRC